MMRLLFLCLLLLPAATAVSKEDKEVEEGSADDGDDEDIIEDVVGNTRLNTHDPDSDKATGVEETMDHFTMIVIIAAVTVLTLSVAMVVTIMLVRRRMHSRQQGIYSVPTEQDQKVSV